MKKIATMSPRTDAPAKPAGSRGVRRGGPDIVLRPDGYHWLAEGGRQEVGPFATVALARADRDGSGEASAAAVDALQQAEQEIGIADWIDPETGEPAEGLCPPHLQED